jgi:deazaflavin-dependent oxidoreductase (nitroreductase family)
MRTATYVVAGLVALAGLLGLSFVVSMRRGYRPVRRLILRLIREVFNPRQMRTAGTPGAYASVVHHIGRVSGTAYQTPVVAARTDAGFVIALPYGAGTDWARNVLAAGSAVIAHQGTITEVTQPEVVQLSTAGQDFAPSERRSHRLFGVDQALFLSSVR